MPRLHEVQQEEVSGEVAAIFQQATDEYGSIPNLFKGLANSPVGLKAYTGLDELISEGEFTDTEQAVVRLTVSQFNGCEYCIAAHSIQCQQLGLDREEILDIRRGTVENAKLQELISFTLSILREKGFVSDIELDAFREAGYTEAHIVEILTIIAQKTLSNYFNHINETELDFPAAPEIDPPLSHAWPPVSSSTIRAFCELVQAGPGQILIWCIGVGLSLKHRQLDALVHDPVRKLRELAGS